MRLRRNETPDGTGKYALIKLGQPHAPTLDAKRHEFIMVPGAILDFGETPEGEFFVLKLKDQFAGPALMAYGEAVLRVVGDNPGASPEALRSLEQYGRDVIAMAKRAMNHPHSKLPT